MEKLLTEVEQSVLNKFGFFELTASHHYTHLSNSMQTIGHFGAAKFFKTESLDEREHYDKIEKFANNMNCEISTEELEKVSVEIANISDALNHAYTMEVNLMSEYEKDACNMELSLKVRLLLQEFLEIQVAAVGEYSDLINRLALTNDMLLFDRNEF